MSCRCSTLKYIQLAKHLVRFCLLLLERSYLTTLQRRGRYSSCSPNVYCLPVIILTSSGLAPNCDETFVRLKSKHPFSDPPVIPHCPSSAPQSPLQLPSGYNMYKLLKSFITATACGPSGMRVQHILDAMKATLPLSLQTTLCHVVDMLLAGQAPACLAPLIAGGYLTALLKIKDSGWDARPIAVGEVLIDGL